MRFHRLTVGTESENWLAYITSHDSNIYYCLGKFASGFASMKSALAEPIVGMVLDGICTVVGEAAGYLFAIGIPK
jgi:hypothetical protein